MIRVTNRADSFSKQVDYWVETALSAGACDLDSLVAALPGVYPAHVLDSVQRLVDSDIYSRDIESTLVFSARLSASMHASGRYPNGLPVPHPLDYDWRFTQQTVDGLLEAARGYGTRLVCLGTPSVFATATRRRLFGQTTLVDQNATIATHFPRASADICCCDVLCDELPRLDAEVVVVDPPWYREHFQAFLWAASDMCPVGTHVLVSLPTKGTRPRIQEEIDEFLDWSRQLGFAVANLDEDSLLYETPPFERNALLASGIVLSSPSWRKGTLCILKKQFLSCAKRPRISPPGHHYWEQASLYGTRFFFRKKRPLVIDDPMLMPLITGNILPSVSRTHRLRQHVDVWTSGNRVFRCQSPGLLRKIVETLATNGDVRETTGFRRTRRGLSLIDNSAQAIHDLACMEREERRFIGNG